MNIFTTIVLFTAFSAVSIAIILALVNTFLDD